MAQNTSLYSRFLSLFLIFLVVVLEMTAYGHDFLIAVPYERQGEFTTIYCGAGQTGGQVQIYYPGSRHKESHLLLDYGRYTEQIDEAMGAANGIENKSIVVSGSDEDLNVLVYEDNFRYNIFSPLPIYALGSKYIVSTFKPVGYVPFLVIATHSQRTDVDITFKLQGNVTYGSRTYTNEETLSLSLNPYQTFMMNSSYDLTGTVISSSRDIAVFTGVMSRSATVAYDQLLPVEHWGQEYVVAVDDNPALYQLQILSDLQDTHITFNNGSTVEIDESGVYLCFLRQNESFLFTTTRPAMVTLFRANREQSALMVVPPVAYYIQQNRLDTFATDGGVNIVVGEGSDMKSDSADILWDRIVNTRFRVGSFREQTVRSEVAFTGAVFMYHPYSVYHTGYQIPTTTDDPVFKEEESYILATTSFFPVIAATTGPEDGLWEIKYPNQDQTRLRQFSSYNTDIFLISDALQTSSGIESKSVFVKAKGGTHLYLYGSSMMSQQSLVPISALGTKYLVSSCHASGDYTSVVVVATHSFKTHVDITFRLKGNVIYDGRVYGDGDTLRVYLSEYQTFTFHSVHDLCGTVIEAKETVAVFTGINKAQSNSSYASSTYGQLLPVVHFGREFVLSVDDPSLYLENQNIRYYFQVLTNHNDTQMTINNGSTVMIKGGFYVQSLRENESLFFLTSRSVQTTLCRETFQDGTIAGESCTIVPPTSLYRKQSTVTVFGPFLNSIRILTQQNAGAEVTLSTGRSWLRGLPILWTNTQGTSFKVGVCAISFSFPSDGSTFIVSVNSEDRFTILGYGHFSIFNGGYSFTKEIEKAMTTTVGPELTVPSDPGMNIAVVAGVICGILVLVLILVGVLVWKRRDLALAWRNSRNVQPESSSTHGIPMNSTAMKSVGQNTTDNMMYSDHRRTTTDDQYADITGIDFRNKQTMSTSA